MDQTRGWSMYSPGGVRGRLKVEVGMPPHPLPGKFLASLPIRAWSPQMAV